MQHHYEDYSPKSKLAGGISSPMKASYINVSLRKPGMVRRHGDGKSSRREWLESHGSRGARGARSSSPRQTGSTPMWKTKFSKSESVSPGGGGQSRERDRSEQPLDRSQSPGVASTQSGDSVGSAGMSVGESFIEHDD